jgi:hypothetical protein
MRAAPPPVSGWQLRRPPATPDGESDQATDPELEEAAEALGKQMRMSPENPLLQAHLALCRHPTRRRRRALQRVQRQLEAARHPATPWLRRLALIELLRQQWGTPPEWELLELELRYSGPEWSIPLPHETLCQLERLKGRAHLEAIVAILADWLEKHSELQGPILGDAERLHPLLVWVALRQWVTTTRYSAWLSAVIDSALGAINHASLPALNVAPLDIAKVTQPARIVVPCREEVSLLVPVEDMTEYRNQRWAEGSAAVKQLKLGLGM